MNRVSYWKTLLALCLLTNISCTSFKTSASALSGYSQNANIEQLDYAFVAVHDQQGYLWFGNRRGLHQYDGYEINTLNLSPNSNHTNAHVQALLIDDNQTLWVGTSKGLNRYNPIKQTLERIDNQHWNVTDELNVSSMVMDKNGMLWMTTLNFGLTYYNTKTNELGKTILSTFDTDANASLEMWDVKIDANDHIWLASKNGLYQISYRQHLQPQHQIKLFNKYTTSNSELLSNLVLKLHLDQHQNIWVGTSKGLNYYHKQSQDISVFSSASKSQNPLTDVNITSFAQDQQDRLWISTWGKGIHIIDKEQQHQLNQQQGFNPDTSLAFSSFINDIDSPTDDIRTNNIYFLLADTNGLMWIIGDNNIKKMRSDALIVDHYDFMPNFPLHTENESVIDDTSVLPRQRIKYIYEDSQGIQWRAGINGLSRFDRANHTLVYIFYELDNNNNLPSSHCATLFEDNQKNIWVGTQVGLSIYDPQTQKFTREIFDQFNSDDLNLAHSDDNDSCAIQAIVQDVYNNIWIANGHRLVKFNPQTAQFSSFNLITKNEPLNHKHNIITIKYDGDNTLWIAKSHQGLGKFDITTNQYTTDFDAEKAPKASINDIRIEDRNKIWIATDNGLWLFDGISQFQHFNNKASNTSTYKSIVLDNANNIWIGTNEGLKSFNIETQKFSSYDKSMGLINDEYDQRAAFKANDHRLYFAGSKGIDHFDPQALKANLDNQPLNVVLTDFILNNEPVPTKLDLNNRFNEQSNQFVLDKAIHYLDSITLNHTDNLFKFEFSTFNYLDLKQTRYAFRLTGFGENWIETDSNNRQATFISIPPGSYQFQVKAAKEDGQWSDIKRINITVLPPWWHTNLAYSTYVITLITLLWLGYRWRTTAIRKRSQALEQKVAERTATVSKLMAQKDQMFANISHEFRTPLTLILNPVQKLIATDDLQSKKLDQQQIKNSHKSIEQNALRLLRMVEQLLEFAKTESNHQQTGLQHYSLKHTIDYLNACFNSLYSSKNLTVTVNNYQDMQLALKPDSLEIILSNLLSNAVKYTPENGSIDINVKPIANQVTISIKDSGIGIAPEHQKLVFERFGRVEHHQADTQASTGIGLALVKELVIANGGTINLTSTPDQGSCFAVMLPIASNTSQNAANVNEISNNSQQITALEVNNLTNLHKATIHKKLSKQPNNDTQPKAIDEPSFTEQAAKLAINKPLILIIDDNDELRALIYNTLSPLFDCLLAENGQIGVQMAAHHLPDLVISDLMMPIMDGFDVLKILKSDDLTAHIPVVMLTAKGDAQSRIEGWNNQADEYLAKPFSDAELIARINNILAIRQLISQRFAQQFAQSTSANNKPPASDNQAVTIDKFAAQFSQKLEDILQTHYQDEKLSVATIAGEMAMSQRQLIRKTKNILDMTPNESVRVYRLQKAATLLKEGVAPSTIAYEVGFASHSYFAACFKAQFGCTPTEYAKT